MITILSGGDRPDIIEFTAEVAEARGGNSDHLFVSSYAYLCDLLHK
jgi:hypothetical protein